MPGELTSLKVLEAPVSYLVVIVVHRMCLHSLVDFFPFFVLSCFFVCLFWRWGQNLRTFVYQASVLPLSYTLGASSRLYIISRWLLVPNLIKMLRVMLKVS